MKPHKKLLKKITYNPLVLLLLCIMEVHRKCRRALLKNGTINHSEISSLFCGRSDSITVSPEIRIMQGTKRVAIESGWSAVSSIDGTTTMLMVSDYLISQITFYFCPFFRPTMLSEQPSTGCFSFH